MAVKISIKHKSFHKFATLSNDPLVIGRSSGANIKIEDELLSRHHCSIYLKSGVATVHDLGSKNGTMLNNNLVEEVHFYLGDVITIGDSTIELVPTTMDRDEMTLHRKTF